MSDKVTVLVDRSRQFESHEKFFSVTDHKGIIKSCNEVFLRVAQYEPEQIIGKPHNVIRHPDMPRCVFKLLWDYLLSDRAIGAYVKNLASTGEYYWVYALAAPVTDGFYSIRIKPTTETFSTIQNLYSQLLEHEKGFGKNWREGMESSTQMLLEAIHDLGYASYDEFMSDSFRQEFSEHQKAIKNLEKDSQVDRVLFTSATKEVQRLTSVFLRLSEIIQAGTSLTDKSQAFTNLDASLHSIAINASVQASHLGQDGAALGVISQEIASLSTAIAEELQRLIQDSKSVRESIFQAAFASSASLLQAQMSEEFGRDAHNSKLEISAQRERYGTTFDEIRTLLTTASKASYLDFSSASNSLVSSLGEFDNFVAFLARTLQSLEFSYVVGKTLCARIESAENFGYLLSQLIDIARSSCDTLNATKLSVRSVKERFQTVSISASR